MIKQLGGKLPLSLRSVAVVALLLLCVLDMKMIISFVLLLLCLSTCLVDTIPISGEGVPNISLLQFIKKVNETLHQEMYTNRNLTKRLARRTEQNTQQLRTQIDGLKAELKKLKTARK